MRLLIDGYNLLHATDLFGAGELAGTLRGSREALLDFLAGRLTAKVRGATVVVFDAADAPAGLADRYDHAGIDVRFARGFADADAMIEHLLEGVHRAKGLTVVSGDRRVQRAARSSGARWADSGVWFADLCRVATDPAEPAERVGPVDVPEAWIETFSDPQGLAEIARQASEAPAPARPTPRESATSEGEPAGAQAERPRPRKPKKRPPLSESGEKPGASFGSGVFDPFPEGYADDLIRDDPGRDGHADGADPPAR